MSSPEAAGADYQAARISRDAFQNGAFHLLQPAEGGFRAGLDALLLAACVDRSAAGVAADIGSGSGAVALATAARAPGLRIVLLERDPFVVELARGSLGLAENAALAPRLRVAEADLFGGRAAREAAGLSDGSLDLVLTNPPFHPHGHRVSPDAARSGAKSEAGEGSLREWLRVASALLREGGRLFLIARPENLPDILVAAENRLGDLAVVPVHSRAGSRAKRILVQARRSSRAPLRIQPPLVIGEADGRPNELAAALSQGSFDGDRLFL